MARALADMDCNIITGGGPGMMQAANEGAAQASRGKLDRSVGIRIDLPFEQDANPFVQSAFTHRTFFTRLHHFVLTSDAFIVVPGGIGTVLEAMMVWQLLQVRHVTNTPLIFVGKMWRELVDWGRTYMLSEKAPWPARRISIFRSVSIPPGKSSIPSRNITPGGQPRPERRTVSGTATGDT